MSNDSIQVGIKMRPLEANRKDDQAVWRVTSDKVILGPGEVGYSFDHVFDQDVPNHLIFDKMAKRIVHAAVKGFNGTIFAYGQTSSGKTYTMMGGESDPGVMVLAAKEIFSEIEKTSDTRQFLLRVGFIEIYNEKINDLLNKSNQDLKIHEAGNGNVNVNCHEICVSSEEQLLDILQRGNKERTVGETLMNERSSRSHSILRLIIESRDVSEDEDGDVTQGLLHLVDLAGSERADQTGARGARLVESGNINKSLLSLSKVIKDLSKSAGADSRFINFRESNLTRILQASLGGNAFTSIICTVKPNAVEQTQSTLNFATRAKTIKNKPRVNEIVSDSAVMKRLEREIKELRRQLEEKSTNQNKLSRIENLLSLKQHNIINSSSLHRLRNRKDNRRRTWCSEAVNASVAGLLSPAVELESNASRLKPPKNFMTPHITLRDYTRDNRPKSSMDMLAEEFEPPDFQPSTPPKTFKMIVHNDSSSPQTPNKSAYIRMIEEELRQLQEFTNLENKVGVEHDLYKSLKQSIDCLSKRNEELEREHLDYLLIKDELAVIKDEFTNVEKCCDDFQVQISKLKLIQLNADKKIEEYELKILQLQKTIESLEQENRNAVELQFEFDHQQNKAKLRENDLEQALKEKDIELSKLKSQLKVLQAEKTAELMQLSHCVIGNGNSNGTESEQPNAVSSVCIKCEELQRENKSVTLEFEKLTSQYNELQLSYEKSVTQVKDTQQQLAQLEEDLNHKLTAPLKECDDLRNAIVELRLKLETVKKEYDELQLERDEKTECCAKLYHELESVQLNYMRLETKYTNLECNWKNQETELAKIRNDYANLESKYNELQMSYDKLVACEIKCVHECQRLHRENDELQQEIQQLKARIEQLQQELSNGQVVATLAVETTKETTQFVESNNENLQIIELQKKCKQFQQENEQLSMDIIDRIDENEVLMKKYKKLEAELEKLQIEMLALEQAPVAMENNSSILQNEREFEATVAETEMQQKQQWLLEKEAFESQILCLEKEIADKVVDMKKLQSDVDDLRLKNESLLSKNESLIETSEQTIMHLREEVLRLSKELLEKSTILENCSCVDYSHKVDRSNLSQFNELLQERIISNQLELSGVNGVNETKTNVKHLVNIENEVKFEFVEPLPKPWAIRETLVQTEFVENSIDRKTTEKQISPNTSNSSGEQLSIISRRASIGNKTLCPQEIEVASLSQSMEIDMQNSQQLIKSLQTELKKKEVLCAQLQLELLEKLNQAENGFRENLRAYNEEWEQGRLQYESKIKDLEQVLAQQTEKFAKTEHPNDISLSSSFILHQQQQQDHQQYPRHNTCSTPTTPTSKMNPLNLSSTEKNKIRAERSLIINECNERITELLESVNDLKAANFELSTALSQKTTQLEEQESQQNETLAALKSRYELALVRTITDREIFKLEAIIDYQAEHLRNLKIQNLIKYSDNLRKSINEPIHTQQSPTHTGKKIENEIFDLLTRVRAHTDKRNCHIQRLEELDATLLNERSSIKLDDELMAPLHAKFEKRSKDVFQVKKQIENMAAEIDGKLAKLEELCANLKTANLTEQIAEKEQTILKLKSKVEQHEVVELIEARKESKEIEELKLKINSRQVELEELKNANKLLAEELKTLKQQKEFIENQNEAQTATINDLKQKNSEIQEKLQSMKETYEAATLALELENKKLKTEVETTQNAYAAALENADTCNSKSEAMAQELHALKLQAQNLTKTIGDYEALEKEYESVIKSKEDLANELRQLRGKENANNAQLESLKDEVKVQQAKEQALQAELTELLAKVQADQHQYERDNLELQSQLKESELKRKELELKNAELEKLSNEFKQKMSNLQVAHRVQLEQSEQISKLELENQSLTSRLQALEIATKDKSCDYEKQLKQRIDTCNKMSEMLDTKTKHFKEKVTKLETTNTCLQEQNKRLSERLEALNEMLKNHTAAALSHDSANNTTELSSTSNFPRKNSPCGKLFTANANGDDFNVVIQKERKNRRLSQHDENRRQSSKFTPILNDVATMTDSLDETCECSAKLKDIERELFIKKSQVTAYTLELRNHPLKMENANLIRRIQEEQQRYRVMVTKYKGKIEEKSSLIRALEDEINIASSKLAVETTERGTCTLSVVFKTAEVQTQSDLETDLHKLNAKYRDLKRICRSRGNEIRQFEKECDELKKKLNEKENQFKDNLWPSQGQVNGGCSSASTSQKTLTESSIPNMVFGRMRDVKKEDTK